MSSSARKAARRRFLAPEVVQTSKMDCGPAALKCLCEGFGIHVSYGRLREACQTDVDGTSIDVLEEVACDLGLDAVQSVVPFDHVLLDDAQVLPALAVITTAKLAHFVIVWRRVGRWVMVMDPAHGRRWLSEADFFRDLYRYTTRVPAEGLREWVGSEEFLAPLRRRLLDLGLARGSVDRLVTDAARDPSYRRLAGLDAATRMLASLTRAGAIRRGPAVEPLLVRLAASERDEALVPDSYWSFWPAPDDDDGNERAFLRGAIVLQVRGRAAPRGPENQEHAQTLPHAQTLELAQTDASPWRVLGRLVADGGVATLVAVVIALLASAAAVSVQALVLRGFLDVGRWLGLGGQRIGAVGAALVLLVAGLLVSGATTSASLGVGRRLELALRLALFRKIPRIHDQYFASRTISDMAERAHSIAAIRSLPPIVLRMSGAVFLAGFTLAGILWLAPWSAPLVLGMTAVASVFGWLAHPLLLEHDRRVRTHVGALARYYLEAFLGATSLSAHGAHGRLMQAQEAVVVRWARAQLDTHRIGVVIDAVQTTLGFGLAWWLILRLGDETGHAANALLLAYWALRLPAIGQALASMARMLPGMLIATERLLEPLQSPEERAASPANEAHEPTASLPAPAISIAGVTVRMGGQTILEDLDLEVAPGSHVAIVGTSGSGKSTLLGLLLGWNRPTHGEIHVDGALLDGDAIARLRRQTAWVDPSVQLWNQSLLANVTYRAEPSTRVAQDVGLAVEAAELQQVLQRLPHGLQSALGENGALISGGEGQRARFARALTGPSSRLVLLDEPFRGLDGEQRRRLLARAREHWAGATLLCATHDVQETLGFDRVLVVEAGRIVEDGDPRVLAGDPESRYAAFLATERNIAAQLWGGDNWKRMRVEGGRVITGARTGMTAPRRGQTMRVTPLPRAAGGSHGPR